MQAKTRIASPTQTTGATGRSHGLPPVSPGRRNRPWASWLALGLGAAFVLLGLLVVTGVTASPDARGIALLRPGDAWGAPQVRYSPWMTRLEPERMYPILGVTALVTSLRRRSWRPLVFAGALAGLSVVVTVAVKIGMERPDPHGYVTPSGGSYPSGHVVGVVVSLAGCLLLLRPTLRWWFWAPVVVGVGLVSGGLLISAAHWPTDVLGGILLGLAVVSAASTWSLRRWPDPPSPRYGASPSRSPSSRGPTSSAS